MFANRIEAGRRLAKLLERFRSRDDVVVLGIPRGGVPVAAEVARLLGVPFDVIIVRKLGVPFQPELAMGAIGENDVRVLDSDIINRAGITRHDVAAVEKRESAELEWRAHRFRGGRPPVPLAGKTVIVVDDGVATGSTARAACQVARHAGADRLVLAVPVAPAGWEHRLGDAADLYVAVETPEYFGAVGYFYDDFSQTTDDEVVSYVRAGRPDEASAGRRQPPRERRSLDVVVDLGTVRLDGHLNVPDATKGIVVFAHGSGSSHHSSRNRFVATHLNHGGIATLLFDLLTPAEEASRGNVCDIDLLATRLTAATEWLRRDETLAHLPLGYFGASTGAAAALCAAADLGADVRAVVSRGGRPDLARNRLGDVRSPTLLIVGGHDRTVLELNRETLSDLATEADLVVVPGATHLFEEPGTLAVAAELAKDWFLRHLAGKANARFG